MQAFGYEQHFAMNQRFLEVAFGSSESLCNCDTYQFEDYTKGSGRML